MRTAQVEKAIQIVLNQALVHDILTLLAPVSILVGSASRSEAYNDIDLIVGKRGLDLAKTVLPCWESVFPGHVGTRATTPPIECMRFWYGPDYSALQRRKALIQRTLYGVTLRAWPIDTRLTRYVDCRGRYVGRRVQAQEKAEA